jgi:hypothetical protein
MSLLALRFAKVAFIAITAWSAAISVAEPVPDAEADRVRAVIVAQLQAFAADDADRAFETNTPGVQQAIGSAGHFLALVRGAYPMVYHPASIAFMQPERHGDAVLQLAEIVDDNGKSWLALFSLEQQADGSWRISGCVVSENRWKRS